MEVLQHWKLRFDPFAPHAEATVPTPPSDEAVARIVHAVGRGERRVRLRAAAGLGKTMILERVLMEIRSAFLQVTRVSGGDEFTLLTEVAERLGSRSRGASPWRGLSEAVRSHLIQKKAIVIAVDDCHRCDDRTLEQLAAIAVNSRGRLTLIECGRPTEINDRDWDLAVRLPALTRGETELYLDAKLRIAGRIDSTFTPRATTRLHARTGGVPRGLDRLASLALMAAACRGLEMIPPEVIDGVAVECLDPALV